MDVVYVYKRGPRNGIELRYSLRSLKNIEHDRVFIVWDKPDRTKNVIHIPVEDTPGDKYWNVRKKINVIVRDDRISDNFIFMHDDHYILKPIKELKYYKRAKLKDHYEKIYKKLGDNKYTQAIKEVYDMFPEWYSFDVHTPIIFNKIKMRQIMVTYWDTQWSKRSIYCNYFNIKWHKLESRKDDIKIFNDRYHISDTQLFLSTDNHIMYNQYITQLLNKLFPEQSQYEKPIKKMTPEQLIKQQQRDRMENALYIAKQYRLNNLK